MVRHSRRTSVPFKEFAEKEQEKLEAERQAELQRLQQMKSEMLETELQNKNNELTLQTTALVKETRQSKLCWKNWISRKRHWVTDTPISYIPVYVP